MNEEDLISVVKQLRKDAKLWLWILVVSAISLIALIIVSLWMKSAIILIFTGIPIGTGSAALLVYKDYREGLHSFHPKEPCLE